MGRWLALDKHCTQYVFFHNMLLVQPSQEFCGQDMIGNIREQEKENPQFV